MFSLDLAMFLVVVLMFNQQWLGPGEESTLIQNVGNALSVVK